MKDECIKLALSMGITPKTLEDCTVFEFPSNNGVIFLFSTIDFTHWSPNAVYESRIYTKTALYNNWQDLTDATLDIIRDVSTDNHFEVIDFILELEQLSKGKKSRFG